jgi:hypothetical protein
MDILNNRQLEKIAGLASEVKEAATAAGFSATSDLLKIMRYADTTKGQLAVIVEMTRGESCEDQPQRS